MDDSIAVGEFVEGIDWHLIYLNKSGDLSIIHIIPLLFPKDNFPNHSDTHSANSLISAFPLTYSGLRKDFAH